MADNNNLNEQSIWDEVENTAETVDEVVTETVENVVEETTSPSDVLEDTSKDKKSKKKKSLFKKNKKDKGAVNTALLGEEDVNVMSISEAHDKLVSSSEEGEDILDLTDGNLSGISVEGAVSAEEVKAHDEAGVKPAKKAISFSDEEDNKVNTILKKRMKKHFRLFNFSRKLMLLCIIPLAVLCLITTLSSSAILRTNLEDEIESSLQIVAVNLEETYSALYEGDYHEGKGGALYKGEKKISQNTKLLDALKEETGCESTFYWGDRCVITTVLREAGGRIAGSRIEEEIYAVLQEDPSQDHFVTVNIENTDYYAYYKALINEDGTAVGYIWAAKPSEEVNKNISKETTKLALSSIGLALLCAVLILVFTTLLSKSMSKTKEFLSVISTGDLRQNAKVKDLKRDDELGDIYVTSYSLQEELKRIVSNVKFSAMELSTSSDNLLELSKNTTNNVGGLYDSVEFISRGATDQAEQTSVAAIQVSNIGDQIENISDEIDELSQTAQKMSEAEKSSTSIIRELNAINDEMIDSINKIAEQIEVTNNSIQGIQTAVEMIQAITDETDLLSINASIEAAHAGDAGRGFAVVAEQISKLALQSGNNAASINETINVLLEESGKMVEYMEDVKVKIGDQKDKLNATVAKFGDVATGVDSSLKNIETITNGMDELRQSRDVILDVISDLSAVSEQYAASTSGTIDAAKTMSDAMVTLEKASQKLKQMSDGLYNELQIFKI